MKRYLAIPVMLSLILTACATNGASSKLKVCPEARYGDRMPQVHNTFPPPPSPPREYFILNGERRELSEFDLDWVEKNCSVREEFVY